MGHKEFAAVAPKTDDDDGTVKLKRGSRLMAKSRGTGFEEFYADPPMTPTEAAEERDDLYHPSRPFVERIEECIQRYRSRRRLTPRRTQFFNKYLFLGGIDSGPRMFQGVEGFDTSEMTKGEARQLEVVDAIHGSSSTDCRLDMYYSPDAEHWDVDFAGVAAGFLSHTGLRMCGGDIARMGEAVDTVRNFLTYVLHHDVCPEHEANIREALAVCQRAQTEMPLALECAAKLPGQFNLAAQALFCRDKNEWLESGSAFFDQPEGFDARAVFSTAIILAGDRGYYRDIKDGEPMRVVDEMVCHLEVIAVHRPSLQVAKAFRSVKIDSAPDFKLAPIGTAVVRSCQIENGWDYRDLWSGPSFMGREASLLLDDQILVRMRPGFKLWVTVCLLNTGLKFIKRVNDVLPSFYTFLPQELMHRFKRPVSDGRPTPTVSDLDAEEREAGKEYQDI